jgi:prepilin-type N-terminal cleavage/methylation domain-containing protein
MSQRRSSYGFSLLELLIAIAITLVVAGAILGLTGPSYAMFQTAVERADMQQRLRIGIEAISKDLMMAGMPGRAFATVLPRRHGLRSPDPPDVFFDDRISVMYAPPAAATTTLNADTASTVAVPVQPQRNCPSVDPLCGFHDNQLISVFDGTGAHDEFRIIAIQDNPPVLIGTGASLSNQYSAGAIVSEIVAATYWLQTDQLMRYDGSQTDSPIADGVVRLRFQYFGGSASSFVPLDEPRLDADLLRIRLVRVTLQVRASRTFIFTRIPNVEINFDIAPRNLQL